MFRRPDRRRAAAGLLAPALLAAGCGGAGSDDRGRVPGHLLRVYASVPLRGDSAAAGRDVADAERLALAQSGGRVGAFRVRLRVLDATDPRQRRWTPAVVAVNARRAARDPATIAYLGESDPAASTVSVVILNEAGIVSLAPTDSFGGLTRPEGDAAAEPAKYYPKPIRTFARLVPDDVLQARALVTWMRRSGIRRPAILHGDDLYGRSLAEEVARQAPRAGLTASFRDRVDLTAASFAPELAQVREGGPDAVLLGTAPGPGVARLLGALRARLGPLPVFAPGALAAPASLARVSPAAQAELRLTDPVASARGDERRAFAAAFRRRYGRAPGPAAAFGYAAMRAVLSGLRRTGEEASSRPRVARAVLSGSEAKGPLGAYALLPGGRTSRRAIGLFRVEDGGLRRIGTLSPSG